MVDTPCPSAVVAPDELPLSSADLARLVSDVEFLVEAHPESDGSFFWDNWLLILKPLGLHHADLGIDAALIGLAYQVGKHVSALLRHGGEERTRLLPLLMRLRLAKLDGSLPVLLQRSTFVVGQHPESPLPLR